jgi:hypothetical protein
MAVSFFCELKGHFYVPISVRFVKVVYCSLMVKSTSEGGGMFGHWYYNFGYFNISFWFTNSC